MIGFFPVALAAVATALVEKIAGRVPRRRRIIAHADPRMVPDAR